MQKLQRRLRRIAAHCGCRSGAAIAVAAPQPVPAAGTSHAGLSAAGTSHAGPSGAGTSAAGPSAAGTSAAGMRGTQKVLARRPRRQAAAPATPPDDSDSSSDDQHDEDWQADTRGVVIREWRESIQDELQQSQMEDAPPATQPSQETERVRRPPERYTPGTGALKKQASKRGRGG